MEGGESNPVICRIGASFWQEERNTPIYNKVLRYFAMVWWDYMGFSKKNPVRWFKLIFIERWLF